MDILRFITAGSVDDGKSTLIGRLLYDSKNILVDQLEQLEKHSRIHSNGVIDLALLTDGLRAEREQGITIDVAYRYFSTPKRKFIIADAPGHVQYTKNMITGASNADLIIILIDARQGVAEQTRRHSIIASLLGIEHVVVAVNKMDLVHYSEEVFNSIQSDYEAIAKQLGLDEVRFIPISALRGENIVDSSDRMHWYKGETLLGILEGIEVHTVDNAHKSRFQVQHVIRPQTSDLHDYRGYAGKVLSGSYRKGDAVTVFPTGVNTLIEFIEIDGKDTEVATENKSVVIRLKDDIDVSRGDIIVGPGDLPEVETEFDALLCWMDQKPLMKDKMYLLQHNSKVVRAVVKEVDYRLNVNTLEKEFYAEEAYFNEIVRVTIKTSSPLVYDAYKELKVNGAAIMIDETSNATVAACLLQ